MQVFIRWNNPFNETHVFLLLSFFPQQPTEYFDMGIFLAFFVVVSLVCLILLIKIKLKQRRSQVSEELEWLEKLFHNIASLSVSRPNVCPRRAENTPRYTTPCLVFPVSTTGGVASGDSSSAADWFPFCADKKLSVEAYGRARESGLAFG